MIEIGLALAAASKAFELIQQGVQTGQDATDLIGKLGSFYDAKDKVFWRKVKIKLQIWNLGTCASTSTVNSEDFTIFKVTLLIWQGALDGEIV